MSSSRVVRAARWSHAIAVVAVLAACTPGATSSDEDDADAPSEQAPTATVTVPPSRLTPFCQEMIDLDDRLETDPPDDVDAEIIETYERIADEVPEEIRADFDAVLADLREGPPPSTTISPTTSTTIDPPAATVDPTLTSDPLSDEGYTPGDTPAARLSGYVDFVCRGVGNNPGPPPTQPLSEPATTEP